MKHIILIGHKKRQGKDTFAEMLQAHTGGTIIRFADPMKEIIADTLGMSLDELELIKNAELPITLPPKNGMLAQTNARVILQRFGTEAMKKQFGKNVWGELLLEKAVLLGAETTIVPDFRFEEEYQYLMRNTAARIITVNIVRPGASSGDEHLSEKGLDGFPYDWVIDNDTDMAGLDWSAELFARRLIDGNL
ncbi:MAG: hypothetical protein IBX43_05135 [Campylobacterales bacterium]|nr:hypothetical protein [Campylobacterales bacterium]